MSTLGIEGRQLIGGGPNEKIIFLGPDLNIHGREGDETSLCQQIKEEWTGGKKERNGKSASPSEKENRRGSILPEHARVKKRGKTRVRLCANGGGGIW